MTLKSLVLLLSILTTLLALQWTSNHTKKLGIEASIRKVRGFYVQGQTWARFDNWRTHQEQTPCQWRGDRGLPFLGNFTVSCIVDAKALWQFKVNGSGEVEAHDAETKRALLALEDWAKLKKKWP